MSRDRYRGGRDLDDQRALVACVQMLVACVVVLSALCGALLAHILRPSGTRPQESVPPPPPPPAMPPRRRRWRTAAFDRTVAVITAGAAVAALIIGPAVVPSGAPESAPANAGVTGSGQPIPSPAPQHQGAAEARGHAAGRDGRH